MENWIRTIKGQLIFYVPSVPVPVPTDALFLSEYPMSFCEFCRYPMKILTSPCHQLICFVKAKIVCLNPYLKRSLFRATWARRRTGRQLSLQASPLLSPVQLSTRYGTWLPIYNWGWKQCCGTGAESRGAEIKLPPEAGAEITNCGFGAFLFTTDLKKFYRKNHVW